MKDIEKSSILKLLYMADQIESKSKSKPNHMTIIAIINSEVHTHYM